MEPDIYQGEFTPDTDCTEPMEWDSYTYCVTPTFSNPSLDPKQPIPPNLFPRIHVVLRSNLSTYEIDCPQFAIGRCLLLEFQGSGGSKAENGNTNNSGNHGVVNYQFYNTQYQNSIDMSDLLSSSATNYGHEGGTTNAATNRQDITNNLLQGLSSVAGLVPLFADSKTEEFANSDRIAMDQRATTAVITQATAGCRTYDKIPATDPSSAADQATHATTMTDRYFTFKVGDWNATQRFGYTWAVPLPGYFLNENSPLFNSAFTATALRHTLCNCGWRCQLEVNATRFHGGALGVFMIPEYTAAATIDNWSQIRSFDYEEDLDDPDLFTVHQLFLYPHQILNPRSNSSVDLEVDFTNFCPSSDPLTHSPWTLVVVVLSTLTYSDSASPALTIQATVAPKDAIFHGLRIPSDGLQGPPVQQPTNNAYQFSTSSAYYSEPVYGHMYRSSPRYVPGKFTDLLQLARIPTLAATPYVMFTSTTDSSNTAILKYDVSLSAQALATTTLGVIAPNFAQYRGSIVVTLIYTGNQMQQTRFLISYTPPGANPPTTAAQAMQSFSLICDTGLNSEFKFTIPYLASTDFRFTHSSIANDFTVAGYLTIWQLTKLACPPGSPTFAQALLFFSAGEDFVFRCPALSLEYQGDETQLAAGETGVSTIPGPGNSSEHPTGLPLPPPATSHSSLRFLYDRFFYSGYFALTTALAGNPQGRRSQQYFQLTLKNLLGNQPEVYQLLMATYFRAELEICVVQLIDNGGGISVTYFPPGSRLPPYDASGYDVPLPGTEFTSGDKHYFPTVVSSYGFCPQVMQRGYVNGDNTRDIRFRIPFCSPTAVLSKTYNGIDRYRSPQALYGEIGAAFWGTLVFSTTSHGSTTDMARRFGLYVRFVDIDCYMPRPAQPRIIEADRQKIQPSEMNISEVTVTKAGQKQLMQLQGPRFFRLKKSYSPKKAEERKRKARPSSALLEAFSTPMSSTNLHLVELEPLPHFNIIEEFNNEQEQLWLTKHLDLLQLQGPETTASLTFISFLQCLSEHLQSVVEDLPLTYPPTVLEENSEGATNRQLLLLAGDVEENPGPSVASKLISSISSMLADKALCKMYDISSFFKSFTSFKDFANFESNPQLQKLVSLLFKFLGYGILAYKAATDPMTLAALTFVCGGDVLSSIFEKIISFFKSKFTTPPPPKPEGLADTIKQLIKNATAPKTVAEAAEAAEDAMEWDDSNPFKVHFEGPKFDLRTINNLFTLARHSQWAFSLLDKLKDWFTSWVKQEQNSPEQIFHRGMAKYSEMAQAFQRVRNTPQHPDWNEVKTYMDQMRDAAAQFEPRYIGLFPIMQPPRAELSRPEPIVLVLRGGPGQGKSVSATLLARMFSQTLTGKPDFYAMNSTLKYFDGYAQQPVVLIDDLGQASDGEDFDSFCQMVSTCPFVVNQADLPQKGMMFNSPIIIATTNLPTFHPNTVTDHQALARRLNFDMKIKTNAAYKLPNGCLDLRSATRPDLSGVSPLPTLLKYPFPLLSTSCVAFEDKSGSYSLVQLFERVLKTYHDRQEIHNCIDDLFVPPSDSISSPPLLLQAPPIKSLADHLRPPVEEQPAPVVSAETIAEAIKQALPDAPPYRAPKVCWQDVLSFFTQAIAIVSMLLTSIFMIKMLLEGPYGESNTKIVKANKAVKMVDLQMQGPNTAMEQALLRRNCVRVKVEGPDIEPFYTTGLFVKDRYMLMNYHLYKKASTLTVDQTYHVNDIVVMRPSFNSLPSDLVLISFPPNGRNYRDILDHFVEAEDCTIVPGISCKGINCADAGPFLFDGKPLQFTDKVFTPSVVIPNVMRYQSNTAPGYCGSPVVVDWGIKKKIVGIHCAGANGIAAAAVITRKGLIQLMQMELQGKITDVKPHPYVYTPKKTAFYPTIAFDQNTTTEPAALSPRDKRLQDPDKFKATIMSKHTGDKTDGPEFLIRAARLYARIVKSKIPVDVSQRLSLSEAVLGMPGLDPMDMNRSSGWPYINLGQRRPDLVKFTNEHLEFDPRLYAEISRYLDGKFEGHKFVTFLKDEPRPTEKVRAGKTRVIDIPSFAHAIVGRVLFGRLTAYMISENGVGLGSALGCNPDIDWTRYAAEFKYQHFVDIDYSGFDATHSTFSFNLLKIFFSELGYDPVAMKFIDSVCLSRHIWDDEEFTLSGGLPSGCAATSLFNTVLNNIIMRGMIPQISDSPFSLLAYGDDLIVNSEKPFDVSQLKELLEQTTLYKVTPASKNGDFEWTSLDKIVFLKRTFKPDGTKVRPVMTEGNLHNIMSWARPGTIQEKVLSVALLAVHSGKEIYDRVFDPFTGTGITVPSFEEVDDEWHAMF